ncbi:hypothetical protein ND748_17830 [Frankia sp. AiPs1]|uniref:hypothetical protein n=1 Tax=Frankia sp. AiPs1 TaxID=573493 RepID=UPI002043E7C3|nr:hypothetical protein [Frankia sp. AiPs1]MCM3923515.1 hypothetical protein [Frankia sp. AiPs1]
MDSTGGELIPALAPLTADAVIGRRDLVFAERTLDAGGATHPVSVGGVSFGRVDPLLLGPDDLPSSFFRRVQAKHSRHVLLVLPFDLLELPDGHRYSWASVRCQLDDPPGYALQLKPGRRLESVPVTGGVGEGQRFPAAPRPGERAGEPREGGSVPARDPRGQAEDWESEFTALAAELDGQVHRRGPLPPPATELRPLVTTFGQNRTSFGWRLDSQPGYPLWYQNVIGGVLVELPKEATEVAGVLTAQAVVLRPWLDDFRQVSAETSDPMSFRVPLD